jgi:hypothetical protein
MTADDKSCANIGIVICELMLLSRHHFTSREEKIVSCESNKSKAAHNSDGALMAQGALSGYTTGAQTRE